MITIGIDPHERSHTGAAVHATTGELLDELTVPATEEGHQRLRSWAHTLAGERVMHFALEDCRHVSGRLERIRVPPKLMGQARRGQRQSGKSDAIDALAVARAAVRDPDLPVAHLDREAPELKLLLDHREDLVRERTAQIQRLRWHLHDVEEGLEPAARGLRSERARRSLALRLARREQTVEVRIARELLSRIGEIGCRERVSAYAPALFELPGRGELTAAKLIAEIAGASRFRSDAQLPRHAGCAPLEASSGGGQRHRLSRRGNRQLNCAFHRIAVTRARIHPQARAYPDRKRAEGKSTREGLRCLKRHLARRAFALLRARDRELPISISPKMQEMKTSPPATALT